MRSGQGWGGNPSYLSYLILGGIMDLDEFMEKWRKIDKNRDYVIIEACGYSITIYATDYQIDEDENDLIHLYYGDDKVCELYLDKVNDVY